MKTNEFVIFCLLASIMNPSFALASNDKQTINETLAPGNMLRISSPNDSSLNTSVELDWTGEASIPLCGKLKLSGFTLNQARQLLESCLSPFFKETPDVNLEYILPKLYSIRIGTRNEKRNIYRVPYGISVHSVLSSNGYSFSDYAILRLLSPHGLDIVLPATSQEWTRAFQWRGGETILLEKEFPEKTNYTIDVLGEVRKPGKFDYRPSQTVMSVLREAQGPTQLSADGMVHVYRGSTGQKIETTWQDTTLKIEPGDALYIPPQREGIVEKSMRYTNSFLAIINTIFLILLARRG